MKGFTLIELLVSLAIFLVITAIVLYNYGSFNDDLILSNLAYEVALEVRTAQVYGLSVLGNDNSFSAGYGVHFDNNGSTNDSNFYLFVDTDSNNTLTGFIPGSCLPGGECIEKVGLQGDSTIEKFCTTPDDVTACPANSPGDYLDIIFKRPDPDAHVYFYQNGVLNPDGNKDARIYIQSGGAGEEKIITVDQSGQISIQ